MTTQCTDNLTDKQRHWLKHIQACQTAGISFKAYAQKNGIEVKTLYYWKKALLKKGILPKTHHIKRTAPVFQRAKIATQPVAQYKIQFTNGIQINFNDDVNEASLSLILKTAAALP